ncbi:hypothetical protein, partial [Enterobacter hormaechei]|uniref:hypothetical protein n=1 Tax=Enterobacter hormaechei TaxID=158836 RepID=UPI001D02F292
FFVLNTFCVLVLYSGIGVFLQAKGGIRGAKGSRGLGDEVKRQEITKVIKCDMPTGFVSYVLNSVS